MMLGPCHGGAVRLAKPGDVLMVGEGVQTCLAAMQASGYPTLGSAFDMGLHALDLPGEVREAIVLADGNKPGEAAARAAQHCAGCVQDDACASPARHAVLTSMTFCWEVPPHDGAGDRNGGHRGSRELRGAPRNA